jgi:predicted ATPase
MAYIVKFEISDLAGRPGNYAQTLNRDVNVFFGVNGSGKTSLLKILHSAMEKDASILENVPFSKAVVVVYSEDYGREFVYSIENTRSVETETKDKSAVTVDERVLTGVARVRRSRNLRWRSVPEIVAREKKITTWTHQYLPTSRLMHLLPEYVISGGNLEHHFDVQFEAFLQRYWSEFFGRIQQQVRIRQHQALVDILHQVLLTRDTKDVTRNLKWETAYHEMMTFLKRNNPGARGPGRAAFKKHYSENKLLRNIIGTIDSVERDIERETGASTKLDELVQRMFSGNKKVLFQAASLDVETSEKKKIGLRALSSGEKQLLYILLANCTVDISSIMIDEPEISMHVDWQNELISAMRGLNPRAQIIAATHSPEIIAGLDDSKIFRLGA